MQEGSLRRADVLLIRELGYYGWKRQMLLEEDGLQR